MRHWSQLATRNWRTRPARSLLVVAALALGVGAVVWVTCCYESVRRSVTRLVLDWIGRAHIILEPVEGVWATFDEAVANVAADVDGIAHLTKRTREYVDIDAGGENGQVRVEVMGILPDRERLFRTYTLAVGRFLKADDANCILVEELLANALKCRVGDRLRVKKAGQSGEGVACTVIGLVDRRRASLNQAPMIWARLQDAQSICGLAGKIKAVDIILADPGTGNIRRTADRIRSLVSAAKPTADDPRHRASAITVKTTEAQHKKLGAAQSLLHFIMTLLACVILLTALFIILATMGMGVAEQVRELGLLRCVGLTRAQLVAVIALQTLPLGVLGSAIGVFVGLALQWVTFRFAAEYLGEFTISLWGVALAVAGGLLTTIVAAIGPALTTLWTSPAQAARPGGTVFTRRGVWLTALLGLGFLGLHELLLLPPANADAYEPQGVGSVLSLYAAGALLAPAVVVILGRPAVALAARLTGLRRQLLGEQIEQAPVRSAAICCGLMVGLSLIICLVVWAQSVRAGWEFPKEFPDALLYSYAPLPLDEVTALRDTDGVRQFTVTDDFAFSFKKPRPRGLFSRLAVLEQSSRFLAIEPEEGFAVVKLTFLEGDEKSALIRLKSGGHILITRELSLARNLHIGDALKLWVGETEATFTVAGVIASPGLDIAISFFNATEYFQFYAVGAVVGTLADAERLFNRRYGKLMLINFDLPPAPTPRPATPGLRATDQPYVLSPEGRPTFALGPGPIPGDGPEEVIVNRMLARLGDPPKAFVTARQLKQQIEAGINRVLLLLSAIPLVALGVSALGLANLMAANVASRGRQIAVLRAIGLTRGQVGRMIVGEALVVGLLGSGLGVLLGMMLGRTSNRMTGLLAGVTPALAVPWPLVAGGALLALLLCLGAASVPARNASRSNIVAALGDV